MAERTYTLDDQMLFARLSGDFNPVHVDPVYARRTMFGGPIVHGMHTVLWMLTESLRTVEGTVAPTRIEARFVRPLMVGEQVRCEVQRIGAGAMRIVASADGRIVTRVDAAFHHAGSVLPSFGGQDAPGTALPPEDVAPSGLQSRAGSVALAWDGSLGDQLFQGIAQRVPRNWLAALAAASTVVGVHCPGLNSVFGELVLEETPDGDGAEAELGYRCTEYDARFNSVAIDLAGPRLRGVATAFVRPQPVAQPQTETLAQLVADKPFRGEHALVVGGSRGLGEVAAKLLAAGGADVVLTYRVGEGDARRVADDIAGAGGQARILRYDAASAEPGALSDIAPTQVYYFATQSAFLGARGHFSVELFRSYVDVYVDGFTRTLRAIDRGRLRAILYPSSVAVEDTPPGMAEYAAAKAAGEIMCRSFAKADRSLAVLVPRLPRLATDQTQSVSQMASADPVPVVLGILREMAATART